MFGLDEQTMTLIVDCIRNFPEINWVKIYGSRAKGDYQRGSDVDLAYSSPVDYSAELHEALDDLSTPYLFDVTHYETLRHVGLREHIERVGVVFYEREADSRGDAEGAEKGGVGG